MTTRTRKVSKIIECACVCVCDWTTRFEGAFTLLHLRAFITSHHYYYYYHYYAPTTSTRQMQYTHRQTLHTITHKELILLAVISLTLSKQQNSCLITSGQNGQNASQKRETMAGGEDERVSISASGRVERVLLFVKSQDSRKAVQ